MRGELKLKLATWLGSPCSQRLRFLHAPLRYRPRAACDKRSHAVGEVGDFCRAPAGFYPMKQSCRESVPSPHSVGNRNLISLSFHVFAFKKQRASRAAAGNADGLQIELARGATAKIFQRGFRKT